MGEYYESSTIDDDIRRSGVSQSIFQSSDSVHESEDINGDVPFVPLHPSGIKPSGNAFTATSNLRAATGTFALIPDELILLILETLDQSCLLALGATCKALYAFTKTEDLWKALFILNPPANFSWRRTWRSTLLGLDLSKESRIKCRNLFSDALYRPFQCTHIPLQPYTSNIPLENLIPRLPDLSPKDFSSFWTDKPFVLTEQVKKWPVYLDWSSEALLEQFGDTLFRAEAVDWPLKTYVDYMNGNSDESPLYLFDKGFVEKMQIDVGQNGGSYWPPECFGDDMFALLGEQRPDNRWLIIGPERSGSTFHKDPNATSAWNAVLRGSKYWIMFPTTANMPPPPGVFISEDQSEVTSPLSIAEWLLTFHAEARRTKGCMEGICNEGEVLHVPSGWWHLVVNLSPAIAITQNFMPKTHLNAALDFLKNRPDQVTGFKKDVASPYHLFIERLQDYDHALLEKALRDISPTAEHKKRKWDEAIHNEKEEGSAQGGFSFGFGGDDESDDIE